MKRNKKMSSASKFELFLNICWWLLVVLVILKVANIIAISLWLIGFIIVLPILLIIKNVMK